VETAAGRAPAGIRAVDWAVVLVVVVVSTTGLGREGVWDGSSWGLAVQGLALGLPLALRRTLPVLSTVLVGSALVVVDALGGVLQFGSFLAVLVALFSVARHVPGSAVSALPAAYLAGCGLLVSSGGQLDADVVFPLFYFSAAWALGRGVRALEDRSTRLHELNEALERDRETTARLAVAHERIRLARELHDVVAHTVMVMVWQAEAAEEMLVRDCPGEPPVGPLRTIQEAGRRGLTDLRALVDVLRDDGGETGPDVTGAGLDELPALAGLMSRSGLDVRLDLDLPAGLRPALAPGAEPAVYRLVQESLTNVVRHSHAARVDVTVRAGDGQLRVRVHDHGPRRDHPRPGSGHGIAGMRERVTALGGVLDAAPHGDGYLVEALVPLGGGER
jgi:signal transduction histidine kinase